MRIGYLMNSYPMTSTTFIRREIQAIEAEGVEVKRYAIRPWPERLVDARDQEEQGRTRYLLVGRAGAASTCDLGPCLAQATCLGRVMGVLSIPVWWIQPRVSLTQI